MMRHQESGERDDTILCSFFRDTMLTGEIILLPHRGHSVYPTPPCLVEGCPLAMV